MTAGRKVGTRQGLLDSPSPQHPRLWNRGQFGMSTPSNAGASENLHLLSSLLSRGLRPSRAVSERPQSPSVDPLDESRRRWCATGVQWNGAASVSGIGS